MRPLAQNAARTQTSSWPDGSRMGASGWTSATVTFHPGRRLACSTISVLEMGMIQGNGKSASQNARTTLLATPALWSSRWN